MPTQLYTRLAEHAADHLGYFTVADAKSLGATLDSLAKLARAGQLERVWHGVYRVPLIPRGPLDEYTPSWRARWDQALETHIIPACGSYGDAVRRADAWARRTRARDYYLPGRPEHALLYYNPEHDRADNAQGTC